MAEIFAGQDEHAISNYLRANKAISSGWFRDEISPVTIFGKKGNTIVADDEEPSKVSTRLCAPKPKVSESTVAARAGQNSTALFSGRGRVGRHDKTH